MYRSLNKKIFVKEIQKLINGVNLKDIKQIPSGVRAQAVDKDGNLVDDFLFEEGENSLHVLNSPSPAATASLAIGESIVSKILNYFIFLSFLFEHPIILRTHPDCSVVHHECHTRLSHQTLIHKLSQHFL